MISPIHCRQDLGKEKSAGQRQAYLVLRMSQRVLIVDRKAEQEHMRLSIIEHRPDTFIVVVGGDLPQGKLQLVAVDFYFFDVVLEMGRGENLKVR
jgi:hypothetical protein